MKKSYIVLGLLALTSVACQNKDEFVASRALTVHGDLTKTTIAYEGDVSHLVWSEGDNVMYLTDDKAGLYDFAYRERLLPESWKPGNYPHTAPPW